MNIYESTINRINDTSLINNYLNLNIPSDRVIIHVHKDTNKSYYDNYEDYHNIFTEDRFKLFIIHDVNKDTIPFIKLADHLVYFNSQQKFVIDELIKLDIPSTILPFPMLPFDITPSYKKKQIILCGDVLEDNIEEIDHILSTWTLTDDSDTCIKLMSTTSYGDLTSDLMRDLNECNLICYFNCDSLSTSDMIHDLVKNYINCTFIATINSSDTTKLTQLIEESKYCYIWNEEISIEAIRDTVHENTDQIFYSNVRENALLPLALSCQCSVIIPEAANTININNRPTLNEFTKSILDILNNGVKFNEYPTNIEADIENNIEPLRNDFVVVINYRNQVEKITRCIESIVKQDVITYDVGILITDDYSTDGSLDIVDKLVDLFKDDISIRVVKNTKRRMSAKNLYNAVHHYISNDESIIIELDGDDFIDEQYDMFSILSKHYDNGSLKTIGSFQSYPEINVPMVTNNKKLTDFSNPWDHGKCTAWSPLRTYKRHLFTQVELYYFLERDTLEWLKIADDSSINPRMIELAKGKIGIIDEPIYIYDLSGNRDSDEDYWSPFYAHSKLHHAITF